MTRWSAWILAAIIAGRVSAAEEALPQEAEEPLEIEPLLLIQSHAADGTLVVQGAGPLADPEVEIAKVEKELIRAKRNADGGERLYKSGIISKLDAESRALNVIRLEAKLAEARLAFAQRKAGEQKVSASEVISELSIAEAEAAAARAAEEKRRAELEAALRNLQRQQKLLALGSGRKADLNRAEQKLAELQRPQN